MGIKGLTKFINDRSQRYFENFDLHDCNLIIDGHSISCQLYNWKHWHFDTRSANCYGGDYDKYAFAIEAFFRNLSEVNVTPYVVFDGGFEEKKLPTIMKRMQDKINIADKLSPTYEIENPHQVVFPLALREVFKDVVRERDIPLAMCIYEGDTEIASLAKELNCPVLTFDSDYFLFGCKYIPFNSIDNKVLTRNGRSGSYKCIQCKLYKIEKLLSDYTGLREETLHLLPVLLGNDYIDESVFVPFLNSIHIKDMSFQRRIQSLLLWLKSETLESAVKKILSHFKNPVQRSSVLDNIGKIISGYYYTDSNLKKYFNIEPTKGNKNNKPFNFAALKDKILKDLGTDGTQENEANATENDINTNPVRNDHLLLENQSQNPISKVFTTNYTKCKYPSSFMDILTQNKYYCIPQVEDHAKKHSHIHSLELLCSIHKILTNSAANEFTVVARDVGTSVKCFVQEKYNLKVPNLDEFEQKPLNERRKVLYDILKIDSSIESVLDTVPEQWHLYLIALKYILPKLDFSCPFIFSLTVCFIILNYTDRAIGYFRSVSRFRNRYPQILSEKVQNIKIDRDCFNNFSVKEHLIFMEKLIKFFEFNPDRSSDVDKNLLHYMAQVQSTLLHIKYLDSTLNFPYPNLLIHRIFNGTFIYNSTKYFQKVYANKGRSFLDEFFQECPNIRDGLKYALDVQKTILTNNSSQ